MASKDLSEEEKNTFVKFVKDNTETKGYYNDNATNYDKFMRASGGVYPIVGAKKLLLKLSEISCPRDAKIADVGAGTGIAGQVLKENGYTNLTAFDISVVMLDEAKKKDIYSEHIECDLHEADLTEYYRKFDHVISIASFGFGLMKPQALDKMPSLVKPGGLVCVSFRETNLASEELRFKQKLKEMEEKGVWKETSCELDEWSNNWPTEEGTISVKGYYMIFQVC